MNGRSPGSIAALCCLLAFLYSDAVAGLDRNAALTVPERKSENHRDVRLAVTTPGHVAPSTELIVEQELTR
jgi:hypothetical protein